MTTKRIEEDTQSYLNIVLLNEWTREHKYSVHKSFKTREGITSNEGEFFVQALLPSGLIAFRFDKLFWDEVNAISQKKLLFSLEEMKFSKRNMLDVLINRANGK